jgi:hypothetical protein
MPKQKPQVPPYIPHPGLPDPDEVYYLPRPPIEDRKEIEHWHRMRLWAIGAAAYRKEDYRCALMAEKILTDLDMPRPTTPPLTYTNIETPGAVNPEVDFEQQRQQRELEIIRHFQDRQYRRDSKDDD